MSSAIEKRFETVPDADLKECIGVLMTAIRHFLPLVFATRTKEGWLKSMWMANAQEKSVIAAKEEVCFEIIMYRINSISSFTLFFICRSNLPIRYLKLLHNCTCLRFLDHVYQFSNTRCAVRMFQSIFICFMICSGSVSCP